MSRAPGGPRHDTPEHGPVPPSHRGRVTFEREVVDRDDGRAGAAQREGVLRVDEGGADVTEQPRQRPGHP